MKRIANAKAQKTFCRQCTEGSAATIRAMYGERAGRWLCPIHADRLEDREMMARAAFELARVERIVYFLVWRS